MVWKERVPESADERFNRYIPHLVLAGLNDAVVPAKYASIGGMDLLSIPGDHSEVIQPADSNDTRYKIWRTRLDEALRTSQPRNDVSPPPYQQQPPESQLVPPHSPIAEVRKEKSSSEKASQSVDVCIVCALSEEATAFTEIIQRQCKVTFIRYYDAYYKYDYQVVTIKNAKGEPLTLHVSWLPNYGEMELTLHLSHVLEGHQPRLVIMTGICAGDEQRVQLGDIVVAERTYTYDNGKFISDNDGRRIHLHDTTTYQPDASLMQFLRIFDDWKPLVALLKRPPLPPKIKLKNGSVSCHIKPMASGAAVRSDNPFQDVQAPVRGTVAIDMEGAAFGMVMSRSRISWLVVKGVSDYADKNKIDNYHAFAAQASALYALSFIRAYVTNVRLSRLEGTGPTEPVRVPNFDHDRTLKDYLRWVIATNSQLILPKGSSKFSISLENVYVALKGDKTSDYEYGQARELLDAEVMDDIQRNMLEAREEMSGEEYREKKIAILQKRSLLPSHLLRDQPGQQSTQFSEVITLAQAFQMERRLIILGGPGSGKTTLVEWLALKLASALEKTEPNQGVQRVFVPFKQVDPELAVIPEFSALIDQIDLGPARLPILVRVANYAEEYARHKGQYQRLSLIDYLGFQPWRGAEPVRNSGGTVPDYIPKADLRALFLHYIEQGKAVIILDGLDELTNNREEVAHEIQLFVSTINGQGEPVLSGGNQVVITSRIEGYRFSPLRGENLTHVIIEPMKRPAVEQFCRDMLAAVHGREDQNNDLAQAQGLINAIYDEQNWRIRELASNPLLITMLSLVYNDNGKLPQQRAGLYDKAIENLIKQVWNSTNIVASIGYDALINVLASVAAYIHETQPSGLLRKHQLVAKMKEYSQPYLSNTATLDEDLENFISVVNNDVGLLAARGNELYGFLHLTFQEYLAGRHLIKDQKQAHLNILKYVDVPRWREPILLALGYIGKSDHWSQEACEQLLQELFNAPDPLKRFLPRMVLLVAKTIPEMRQIDDSIISDVIERLLTVYSDQRLLAEYNSIQDQVEDALVLLRLHTQKSVDNALVKFVRENPTTISALAHLVYKHEWLTSAIVETLQHYIDYDSPEWDWEVNRVLQYLVTPPARLPEMEEPQQPDSPNVLYHKMRQLQEELRRLDKGETFSSLATEIKVMYQRKAEMEGADFPVNFSDLDQSVLAIDANIERVRQLLADVEEGNTRAYLELMQKLLKIIKDGSYRTYLLENITEAENAYKVYQIEYKHLIADYAIADTVYRERIKKQQQVVRAPLSLDYLKLRTALKHNRQILHFVQNNPIWLRLITAFYGGFGDYQATYWSQELIKLTILSSMNESVRNSLILQNREYYVGRWGYPHTDQKLSAYLKSKQNGNQQRITQAPEFHMDYIYRGTSLHPHLLSNLLQETSPLSLITQFWGTWHDDGALLEKRTDALVALALLGQDVVQALRFASERHFALAQKVLLKMAQIASSLEDAVVRSREGILEQIPTIHLPDAYWIDFVQIVVKTLIVATKQPVDIKKLAAKAPAVARPLLEADTWFFSLVAKQTHSLIIADPLVLFSGKLKKMQQNLQEMQPKDLADHYTRAVLSAWRAPNVAAAPLLNLSHAWQLDPLALESTDPYDISMDMLDGLESFYALNDLHPLYGSAFRTLVLMSFQENFQQNPDLLPEIILLCLPYLRENPHFIADLDPGFLLAEQPMEYLHQKILHISHPFYRARAILRLMRHITFPSDTFLTEITRLMALVQVAYAEITDVHQKVAIMERFLQYHSPQAQEGLFQQLYTHACLIPHAANRVRALVRIARLSPSERFQALLIEAVQFTSDIDDEQVKAELLSLIGQQASHYPDIAAPLSEQTQALSTDWLQAKARGLLATHLLQSCTQWAGTAQQQTLWTPLLVSASFHEIRAYFMNTNNLESLWTQFAENTSNEVLFALLDQGAEAGLILTHTAVRSIDTIITRKNGEMLHNLLPLLHSPSINDSSIIETWLSCPDAYIADHAALFITESSRKLTPRYIPHLIALLNSHNDRSRDRVHIMLVNGTENVNDRNRSLHVSTLGPTAIEMLISDSLKFDESGLRLFSTAAWVTIDLIHDSPEQLQRWINDYNEHPTRNSVAKYILRNIDALSENTLDVVIDAILSNEMAIQVRTALLTSICTLAVTQKKNKKLFMRILPVLRKISVNVLDTISVLPNRYKAVIDAAKAALAENGNQTTHQQAVVAYAESRLLERVVKLSSILDPSDQTLSSRLEEIGDTFFVPLDTIDPQTIEAANTVGQDPELFKTLVFWMQKCLQEFADEGVDDHQKLNALLCVVAEIAKRMPATFATLAQPDLFEPLLIYVACHGDHWQSSCAAIELLGLLRFVTGHITQLLEYTLTGHHAIQQATLNLIGNLQNLQHSTMTDLINILCSDKMLYHESALVTYTVASILSLLGRNVYLDQKQRLTIQAVLAATAEDMRSRRGVYILAKGGLADDHLRITLLCRLNQAFFRAALETLGML